MTTKGCLAISLLVLSASTLHAQPPSPAPSQPAAPAKTTQPTSRAQIVNEMVAAAIAAAPRPAIPHPFLIPFGTGRNERVIAYLIAAHTEREGYTALLQALEARASKQLGSTPGSGGSTSLAMKGLVPDILGVAVESGAINRDVSGTTVTFRATPAGVVKALQGKGLIEMYGEYANNTAARMASRISAAASFDTSKGSSAGTFTAGDRQLTGWSVRGELINHRDPASGEYADLWKGVLRNEDAYSKAVSAIDLAFAGWPAFTAWEATLEADVKTSVEDPFVKDHDIAAAGARFHTLLDTAMATLEKLPAMPGAVTAALDGYVAQLTLVQSAINTVYNFVGKGDLVTFDWSTARSATLPDLLHRHRHLGSGAWRLSKDRPHGQRRAELLPRGAAGRAASIQEL